VPAPETAPETASRSKSWLDAVRIYREKPVRIMLLLGFSAGLPLLLVISTLALRLREAGVSRTEIGFLSWIGIAYSIKVFWAPLIDHLSIGGLSAAMGRRRSWMLVAMAGIAVGLLGMALTDPAHSLTGLVLCALLVAFCSATQDVVIDAYRIEIAPAEMQGALAAAYQLGYRVALLVAGAGALYIADGAGWQASYAAMSALMIVGIVTVLMIPEPDLPAAGDVGHATAAEPLVHQFLAQRTHWSARARAVATWFLAAVVCPFLEFFRRAGRLFFLILLFVAVYRISDFVMGVMANPFYVDLGFTKTEIANVIKVFGFAMTLLGTFVGGVLVARYGIMGPLCLGAAFMVVANLMFALLAWTGRDWTLLTVVISADSISGGLAGSAFIAYLSSLTRAPYTATQYALFSSLMVLPGKFIGGFSGIVVDAEGYMKFFIYAGMLGLPAIFLGLYLWHRTARKGDAPATGGET
jgi:PAT family beta-lactamase induction signal transducer AmpG